MNDLKRDMMRIQELIGNAFRQTGSLVALTDGGQMNPNKLQKTLEQTMEQFEAATLELRKLCERYAPGSGGFAKKPILPSMDVTGSVEAFAGLMNQKAAELGIDVSGLKKAELVAAVYDASVKAEGFIEVTGVLDILADGYGFLRTQGYLPSETDCYVGLSTIRRNGLRKGDMVRGQTR